MSNSGSRKNNEAIQIIHPVHSLENMMQISRAQLLSGATCPLDVYLKLPSGKLVLLIKEGGKVNLDELHATSNNNNNNHLFVYKADYPKLLGFSLQLAGVVISRQEISEAKKLNFLASSADGVFREIEEMGFDTVALEHTRHITQSLMNVVEAKSELRTLISALNSIDEDLVKHSLAVSALSVLMAQGLGWTIPTTLEKIALGGFLHDIGLKEIPEELIHKPRHQMSFEEVKTYEEHVQRGAEILGTLPELPDDVVAIAIQHHENSFGMGYPRKLKDLRINPLAKLVSLADVFSELVMTSKKEPKVRSPEEAIKFIELGLGQPFNKDIFGSLKTTLSGSQNVGRVKIVS